MTPVDAVRESEEVAARSCELTKLLNKVTVVLDRSRVDQEEARSRELLAEVSLARRRVVEAVRRGDPVGPGVVLGVVEPIRKVPSDRAGYAAYMALDGRDVLSDELVEYWRHRQTGLASAVREMFVQAAAAAASTAPLRASGREHLARLRSRETLAEEGGEALLGALNRLEFLFDEFHRKLLDAADIEWEASARLADIDTARFKARLFERDGEAALRHVDNVVFGRLAAMVDEPVMSPVRQAGGG
jgi:hypothetical protein